MITHQALFKITAFKITPSVLLCLVLFAASPVRLDAAEPADLVLRNGNVFTLDDQVPHAQAVAVREDRILAVGSNQDIARYVGPSTRVLDLEGRLTVPGFIEGHGHFISLGRSRRILDHTQTKTWEEVVRQVALAARQVPAGRWIVGRGWHQGNWERPPVSHIEGYPTHETLSRAAPDHPVLLTHRSGHMLIANARAMRLAGVDAQTLAPAGGEILRLESGAPSGVFGENAMGLIQQAYQHSLGERSADELEQDLLETIRLAGDACLRHGVTSFHDAGSSFADVQVFQQLVERGELPVRLWVMLDEGNEALARYMANARVVGAGQNHLTVRAIKRMIDGALGTHGAWLLEPYEDLPRSTGHNTTSIASLSKTAELALAHDYQLCVHAIGDRANREVLDLFARTARIADLEPLRWRIEHAQHLHPVEIPRFRELGIIASMQGNHCTSDAPFVIARLGQRRAAEGAYAWRRLLDAAAVVINGTDAPVEPIDPIACFYSSVTRKLPNGVAFFPEQAMTRREAMRSYTRDAAWAAFEEDLKGTVSPGKLADLVVLSRDILTIPEHEILETRVVHTIVGGQVLYSAR